MMDSGAYRNLETLSAHGDTLLHLRMEEGEGFAYITAVIEMLSMANKSVGCPVEYLDTHIDLHL